MKKFSLVSLAAAAALAISPISLIGQIVDFTATGVEGNGQNISVTAVFTLNNIGGDLYQIVGATGSVVDPSDHTWGITGVTGYIPYDICCMDNQVTVPDPVPGQPVYEDSNGIGFTTNDPNDPSGPTYGFYVGPLGSNTVFADNGVDGTNVWLPNDATYGITDATVTFTYVAEGGAAVLYLLLAGGACFGAMFFFSRNRFANLTPA